MIVFQALPFPVKRVQCHNAIGLSQQILLQCPTWGFKEPTGGCGRERAGRTAFRPYFLDFFAFHTGSLYRCI